MTPQETASPELKLTAAEEKLADEAEKRYGVRPHKFYKGRPVFTVEDMKNPNFKSPYPPEPEWEAEWRASESSCDGTGN